MAPLLVEGHTLGQKHESFNKIVNDAVNNYKNQDIPEVNYAESDLDNLFKISIACKNRNVDYILEVLKCKDMLYISRAIKQSTWLITDPIYAHIINPSFLCNELFPEMTPKAIRKLLSHIRLHLKDESRAEAFFNYYKEEDFPLASKWLPFCSSVLIENCLRENTDKIPNPIIIRLCEKSISYLNIYLKHTRSYMQSNILSATMFLLKDNCEKYLDIIKENNLNLTPKLTKTIMLKCGDKIIENFELYENLVDIVTFARFIKREEAKDFILKLRKSRRLRHLLTYDRVGPFINRLPIEDRFEVVKDIFIEKKKPDPNSSQEEIKLYEDEVNYSSHRSQLEKSYSWYKYATFSVAMAYLKNLIRKESNATERLNMLKVLIVVAKKNAKDVRTLLKYYRENHINEPFKFKIQFVNYVISKTDTHTLDKSSWGYLNDLFVSMEVYKESDGTENIQSCVKCIMIYNIVHNEKIQDIIEKKFEFETCKKYKKIMTQEESNKVFTYLLNRLTLKIDKDITEYNQFTQTVDTLENILHLLLDWDRELQDYPQILQKIKEIIKIKKEKSWDYDILRLYRIKKSWKKIFFAESFLLDPNQETCINALKHGPELLETYKTEVELMCLRNNSNVSQFLNKLRIYWPKSLSSNYEQLFMNNLNQVINHKASVKGLCTLLPQKGLTDLAKKYVPTEDKIDWSQHDELILSLRKHIATRLHLARPQPPLEMALAYGKGDYIQYVLPSLNALLYNMSCHNASEDLKGLLNAPVSLQKHGIRISTKKLKTKEITQLFPELWKLTKNSSIRSVLFSETFNILCKERDTHTIKIIWELLCTFIDTLTPEENQSIYRNLSEVLKVPASVKGEFWIKSYNFLNSLPASADCGNLVKDLQTALPNVMEYLKEDFIINYILDSLDDKLITGNAETPELSSYFIWLGKSEEEQLQRYNKVIVPILDHSFALWDTKHKDQYNVRINLIHMYKWHCCLFEKMFQKKYTIPITVYKNIYDKIQSHLPVAQNYYFFLKYKLLILFTETIRNIAHTNEELINGINQSLEAHDMWQPLYEKAAPEIGQACIKYLQKDVSNLYPSTYYIFAKALLDVSSNFNFKNTSIFLMVKSMLEDVNFNEGYLTVIQMLHIFYGSDPKDLFDEILETIQKHPSEEIQMQYWCWHHEKECSRTEIYPVISYY